MRRTTARLLLLTGILVQGSSLVRAESLLIDQPSSKDGVSLKNESGLVDQQSLPTAIEIKGSRPKSDPSALPPAATSLSEPLVPLTAPPPLALPDKTSQVKIRELRPLTLEEVEQILEVNSPSLKAAASQVDQAKSFLREQISLWYPTLDLNANGLPQYFEQEEYRNPDFLPQVPNPKFDVTDPLNTESPTIKQPQPFYTRFRSVNFNANIAWNLIDPKRVPLIAAARDQYEQSQENYLINLRELRLQAAEFYFNLQNQDDQVRIGQADVRESLVSLQISGAKFQAGVVNKLDVLEAETQLARAQQNLTVALSNQAVARRRLAALLDLPQDITPTAATPAQVTGSWLPSLQESIIAAYTFREELDNLILDISIANSNANSSLAAVQPIVSLVNTFSTNRREGGSAPGNPDDIPYDDYTYGWSNTVGLQATWRIFDGGAAQAGYRRFKQQAKEQEYNFASERDQIRFQVESSFNDLRSAQKNIHTTSIGVVSSREALQLSRLRFDAGVGTQREIIDNQRDLTQAEVRYSTAITQYNTSLARLRRFTGLDQVQKCVKTTLPAEKPGNEYSEVPIIPIPERSACDASVLPVGYIPSGV